MIEYSVVPNPATNPPSYRADVHPSGSVSLADIANDVAQTNLASAQTVTAIVKQVAVAIEKRLQAGQNVNLDEFLNFETSITAKLETPSSDLPADAKINIRVNPSQPYLRSFRADVQVRRIESNNLTPNPTDLKGLFGADPTNATAGNAFDVSGSRLNFKLDRTDEGVFLVDSAGSATRVTTYQDTTDSHIQFALPTGVAAGTYFLEIRSRGYSNNLNDPPRSGRLNRTLTLS